VRVTAVFGLGSWLLALGLSLIDTPEWIGWFLLAVGAGLLIASGLWWVQSRPGWGLGDRARQERLAALSRQLGTELRDIRHKVEIVQSTRPHPHYSHGFHLPAARWDEFDDELATFPDLYKVVERAYTAAHHVNEALEMRRTRARKPEQTLGVIKDDGLDEAYEAAGDALDALEEPRGEVWETAAGRAVRLVAEDVMNDLQGEKADAG
jgi:hypothetical protein